ncbi:MAG: hypothetical protein SPF07_03635 [Eubacteriales bacterium]|nr:hypothetical protein [Eubacteriales bacterium]
MKQIELGTLTKPQGLKGEFRIKHNIDSFQLFKDLKNIVIGKNQYTVLSTTDRGGFFVVKTKELTDINQVESLRGQKVYTFVDEHTANIINNNLGYQIVVNSETVGTIVAVDNFGSTDIYTLDNGKTIAVVPNLIISVDDDKKIVKVDGNILSEVMV